jgi:rubredoxin
MMSATDPQCPRCGAAHGQARLTAASLGRLQIDVQREVAAHFDTAHQCSVCGAPYSFRSGASFPFIAAGPKPAFTPLPNKIEQT